VSVVVAVAFCLPWALAAPHAFVQGAIVCEFHYVVFVTLDLVDKLSFFNEWELAAGLVLGAGAESLGSFGRSRAKMAGTYAGRALLRGRGMNGAPERHDQLGPGDVACRFVD
jgi:hypothetical protein